MATDHMLHQDNTYPLIPHFYIAKLRYAEVYHFFFSSSELLGSQGELIGWP